MTEPLVITRVTHSCHLIQIGGLTVLTDPWFSQRALYHPGEPIAFQPEQLPRLDAVVISHEHYDHCDLEAFRRHPGKDVPLLVAGPVVEKARKAGFTNVRALEPWQSARVGDLTISAAPGKHGVYEVTYVISGGGRSVYFAGDTLLIPELRTLTDRYGPLDVALLPVNGLQIRMAGNKQVVMNAEEAAELTAVLRPRLAVPQHYAFTGGTVGDMLFLKSDKDPSLFVEAARRLAPDIPVKVISPGEPLAVAPLTPDPEQPSGAPTMPSDDSSVRDALNHQSLQVSRDDPGPRPMIAVLDARPGLAGQLREKIAELAAQVRREPGYLTFTAYEARDVPGRFYLYEVYASAAAFAEHLQTRPVHDFIAAVPALSTAQPGSLVQLDETTVG